MAISGVTVALPGQPLTWKDVKGDIPPDEAERVAGTVGLERVYRAPAGMTAGDLCTVAAGRLMTGLGWSSESVDGILMVTQTPDHFLPNTASRVHASLGLDKHAFAFDISMGCSGFVYGLWVAGHLLNEQSTRRILLVMGDTLSQAVSPLDRSSLLFGDAGAAVAVEWDQESGETTFIVGADGSGADSLMIPAGAFREREFTPNRVRDEEGNARSRGDLYMDGLDVFSFTLREVPPLIDNTLQAHHWTRSDVDLFLLHQPNLLMLNHLIRKGSLPPERTPVNIQKYGNTAACTIPLLLTDHFTEHHDPVHVVCAGFGVGFAWAAAALTMDPLQFCAVFEGC